jgi:hypothetical protein
MDSLRSTAINLLRLEGHDSLAAASRHHARNPQRTLTLAFTGFGGWAARLNGKVLLTWDDKGYRGLYHSQFEEHFLRARYRMVERS